MTSVSIIIPAYNQAGFLAQAIESALGQTHPAVEVVVVDDGSTDRTPEVAASYRDRPKFKYVRQENQGLPGARNRGLAESSGAYLCFLDSDDCYLPEKAARQASLLDEDPELGLVYCDITVVDASGQPAREQAPVAENQRALSGDIFESLMVSGYFPPHTVMIRRSVLDQVGPFDRALGGHADYDLWLRVAGAGFKAAFIPERLALYRRHGGSMSRDGLHMEATCVGALRKIVELYPDRSAAALRHLQSRIHELHLSNKWLRERTDNPGAQADNAALRARLEATVLWKSKLEAGIALAACGQKDAAVRLMVDGVKAVQSCRIPEVILQALLETCASLGPLDPGRARYLLGLASKFAAAGGRSAEADRAARMAAALEAQNQPVPA